jgi:hypothetical protein
MSLLLRYPLWYLVTNATNPSSMNIFQMLACSVFFYRIPNISGTRPGCLLHIYIKINNNSQNRSTWRLYASVADFLNLEDLTGLLSMNCHCNFCSLNICSNNHHCLSTANLVHLSSKNDQPTRLSDRLSTMDSQSMAGVCCPCLSAFLSTIINSINNSFLASSTNPWTMEQTWDIPNQICWYKTLSPIYWIQPSAVVVYRILNLYDLLLKIHCIGVGS